MTMYVKKWHEGKNPEVVDEILARRKRMEETKRRVEELIREQE